MSVHVLLTGANGYIGLRLLPSILEAGHRVTAMVRSVARFPVMEFERFVEEGQLEFLEADLLQPMPPHPAEVDVAYYLVHSLGTGEGFESRERDCAQAFAQWVDARTVIYLSGLIPEDELSPHLASREEVNQILRDSPALVTTLRASIIVGSGSASFEIIRDLVEKLPFMLTPQWTANRCQPIAIRNVIGYLTGLLERPSLWGREFDIGGPEILTYRELLRRYSRVRGLFRFIIPVPFLSPALSARWLYLVTSTSYPLACELVGSLINETICRENELAELMPQPLISYEDAIRRAFARIAQNRVPSSWFDSLVSGGLNPAFLGSVKVPSHGVLRDEQVVPLRKSQGEVIDQVWSIGGENGWPNMNWAWRLRGWLDRLCGGIGLRRGRRHPTELKTGDALDFWRVLLADRETNPDLARLILAAEMKMPGEAWLQFEITSSTLRQTATFRPRGVWGRIYWFSILPFHQLLFPSMARRLACGPEEKDGV